MDVIFKKDKIINNNFKSSTKILAVIGNPIEHSLSPLLHKTAYRILNLDWTYIKISCDESDLLKLIQNLPSNWHGFSVTMPLKSVAYTIATQYLSATAKLVRSVNTLYRDVEKGVWLGDCTDVYGAIIALQELLLDKKINSKVYAVILGSGNTARAILLAFKQLQIKTVYIVVRDINSLSVKKFTELLITLNFNYKFFVYNDKQVNFLLESAILTVNTLPISVGVDFFNNFDSIKDVFDVLYFPQPTPISLLAKANNGKIITGEMMLIHQAIKQVELFTGDKNLTSVLLPPMLQAIKDK